MFSAFFDNVYSNINNNQWIIIIKCVLFYTFALTFINIEDTECTDQKAVVATVYERIGLFSYRNATFCSTMVVIKCTSNNYYLSKQYTVCIPVIQTSTALICLTGSSGFCVVSYQVHVTSVYGNLGITANVSDSIFNQRTQESCPSLLIWQMHVCKINY